MSLEMLSRAVAIEARDFPVVPALLPGVRLGRCDPPLPALALRHLGVPCLQPDLPLAAAAGGRDPRALLAALHDRRGLGSGAAQLLRLLLPGRPHEPAGPALRRLARRARALPSSGPAARRGLWHRTLPLRRPPAWLDAVRYRRLRRGDAPRPRALRARGHDRGLRGLRARRPALRRHHDVGHHRTRAPAGRPPCRRMPLPRAARRRGALDTEPAEYPRPGSRDAVSAERGCRPRTAREVLHRAALPLLHARDSRGGARPRRAGARLLRT